MRKNLWEIFLNGLIYQNPVLVQFLGICSVLAVTTSLQNAFGMSMAVIFVLTGSNIVISLLRKIIPNEVRIISYIVVISGFVTSVELLMKAYVPEIANSLGIFLPLVVVNCIILARAEAFASRNGVLESAIDGLASGIGYAMVICVVGLIRELIGSGMIWGKEIMGVGYEPATLFILPAGAFLILGLLIALYQGINDKIKEAKK